MVKHSPVTLDLIFHALSDATRRDIILTLRNGPQRVTDLAKPYKMSLPAVSKHLKVLQSAGLVERQQQGREHVLHLNFKAIETATLWLGSKDLEPKKSFDSKISFEPVDSILL